MVSVSFKTRTQRMLFKLYSLVCLLYLINKEHTIAFGFEEGHIFHSESTEESLFYSKEESSSDRDVLIKVNDGFMGDFYRSMRQQSARILNVIASNEANCSSVEGENMKELKEEYEKKFQGLHNVIQEMKVEISSKQFNSASEEQEAKEKRLRELEDEKLQLKTERDALSREFNHLKIDFEQLNAEYKKMKNDYEEVSKQKSVLKKEHDDTIVAMTEIKLQLAVTEKENKVLQDASSGLSGTKYVSAQNILKGMVNLSDRIQKKLQKIETDVKKKQQEELKSYMQRMEENYKMHVSHEVARFEKKLKYQKDEDMKHLKALAESHKKEKEALLEQIAAYEAYFSEDTDKIKRLQEEQVKVFAASANFTAESSRRGGLEINFVLNSASAFESSLFYEEIEILEASVDALEHQTGIKNHKLSSQIFQQILKKALDLLPENLRTKILSWLGGVDFNERDDRSRYHTLLGVTENTPELQLQAADEVEHLHD